MAGAVAANKPAAGPGLEWSFACPDWAERLEQGRSLVPDLPLNDNVARQAVDIYDTLVLPDVPGTPALKEAGAEFQRDMVRAIFGSLYDGVRYVPEVLWMLPKKNSKTTSGAAILVTALLLNERPRAELIYVGPTQEVAQIAFQQSVGMIEADPYASKRFTIDLHKQTIFDRKWKATAKIKTFDLNVMTGAKPVFVLLDELHLMSNNSKATRILGQIRGGLLPNPEACLVMITTQSDAPPAGVFKQELQHARQVRDGAITDSRLLPVLYEFPVEIQTGDDKRWMDPSIWHWVTPNMDRSITLARLLADFNGAKDKGDEELRRWASQHLNIEIGMALHMDRWPAAAYWPKRADATLTFEALLERSEVIVWGADGGGLDDLFGGSAIGREKSTGHWLNWNRAWCQPDVLERRKDIAEQLLDFQRDGDLVVCKDPTQDLEELAGLIKQTLDAGLLPERHAIGLDPMGITALVDELVACGITADQIVGVPQGFRLTGTIKGTERKLKDGTLRHHGSGLMNFCVSNARCEQRGNGVLITKAVAGTAKIDPLIATFNAVALMSRNPVAFTAPVSPWDDPNFRLAS